MNRRRILLALAGLVLVAGATLFGAALYLTDKNDETVRELAGPELGCPPSDVEILDRQLSDTGEVYAVRGCGRRGELMCSAPDFECFFTGP